MFTKFIRTSRNMRKSHVFFFTDLFNAKSLICLASKKTQTKMVKPLKNVLYLP